MHQIKKRLNVTGVSCFTTTDLNNLKLQSPHSAVKAPCLPVFGELKPDLITTPPPPPHPLLLLNSSSRSILCLRVQTSQNVFFFFRLLQSDLGDGEGCKRLRVLIRTLGFAVSWFGGTDICAMAELAVCWGFFFSLRFGEKPHGSRYHLSHPLI